MTFRRWLLTAVVGSGIALLVAGDMLERLGGAALVVAGVAWVWRAGRPEPEYEPPV